MSFFVKPYARFQGARFVVVLVLVLDKILIFEDENEDEKYQLRPPDSAHM
jgi:hypothetical protein